MANRRFTQFFNTLHNKPVYLDCNFIVDPTNGNGLGIRSLKGGGFKNVFMHTTQPPLQGNPNPIAGLIMVQMQDCYNRYYGGGFGFVSPLSGTPINISAALVVGHAYTIVSVGTSTAADWYGIGLPYGFIPTVGQTFIATTTGGAAGTGVVEATTGSSTIMQIEAVGDPNASLTTPGPSGGYLILQCLDKTGALAAPAAGTVIGLTTYLSSSRIQNAGE